MLKRKEHQDEKDEGFLQKLFQKLKEISFYSYMLSFLIAVLLLILFLIYLELEKRNRDLKVPQTVIQTQLLTKEKFSKNEEIYLNETLKLNSKNFEVFISEKDKNKGIILIKASDFIKNNSNLILYKIELDSNRHDNSILNLQINPELLTKDSIINDETLLTIEYVESYVE